MEAANELLWEGNMDASERRVLAEAVAKVRNRIEQIRERNESIGEQDTKATLIVNRPGFNGDSIV